MCFLLPTSAGLSGDTQPWGQGHDKLMLSNLPNTRALLLGILFFKQAFTLTSAQHHGINTYAITLKYFFFCKSRYAENDFLEPIFGADNTLEIQSSRESTI